MSLRRSLCYDAAHERGGREYRKKFAMIETADDRAARARAVLDKVAVTAHQELPLGYTLKLTLVAPKEENSETHTTVYQRTDPITRDMEAMRSFMPKQVIERLDLIIALLTRLPVAYSRYVVPQADQLLRDFFPEYKPPID